MRERYYRTAAATLTEAPPRPAAKPPSDTTRTHAANWAIATGVLTLCAGVGAWVLARAAGVAVTAGALALAPLVAILAGGIVGAVQLLRFTSEHRDWLYALEDATLIDLDGDGIAGAPIRKAPERPPVGALIRGTDGGLHRVDVDLTPSELQAVKRHMLVSGSFGVRACNAILGDETRASALRTELHRLGILTAPKPRTAARLTPAGTKAVMRWQ